MPLVAPYLIIGFDVDVAHPNGAAIIQDVQQDFPLDRILPLGVENVWCLEVPESQMNTRFNKVATYLDQKDTQHGGVLRWVVQLCLSADIGGG